MHNKIVELLNSKVPGCNAKANIATVGDSTISVEATHIVEVCKYLKNDPEYDFNVLHVISGTDYKSYMDLSYIISSYSKNLELIIKVNLSPDNLNVNTLVPLWPAANFLERECYDMLGIKFTGHPDLRRILCPDDWEGFPLRKDYVPAEKYNGMVINPPDKVNTADHMFASKLRVELGDPKKVSGSWKVPGEAASQDGE